MQEVIIGLVALVIAVVVAILSKKAVKKFDKINELLIKAGELEVTEPVEALQEVPTTKATPKKRGPKSKVKDVAEVGAKKKSKKKED